MHVQYYYIVIGLYASLPKFFGQNIINQFHQTLSPPNILTIWYMQELLF